MTAAEIASAIRRLPLTHTNLVALVASLGCYADDLYKAGGLTGMEEVCDLLTDAFSATDAVLPITAEQRSEWAREAGEGAFADLVDHCEPGPWKRMPAAFRAAIAKAAGSAS